LSSFHRKSLYEKKLLNLCTALKTEIAEYKTLFQCGNHNCFEKAHQYLCGLFQSEVSNISSICEVVVNTSYDPVQHFISHAPWDATPVKKQVALNVQAALLPIRGEQAFLIDEYGCTKQGQHSVGVARQYLGSEGKVDNGQVTVVGVLSKAHYASIITSCLFLPEEWTNDAKRMKVAGVPEEAQEFQTKLQTAVNLAKQARKDGVLWDFCGADALYGRSTEFRRTMDALTEYVFDIPSNQTVYLADPKPFVPERTGERGGIPSCLTTKAFAQTAAELVAEQPQSAWETIEYRSGTKGVYRRQALALMVWTWDGKEECAVQERLIASRSLKDPHDIKYSLANDPEKKRSLYRLLVRQMHRYWVERSIQDGKSEIGMVDYQVRSWQALEHHLAMTMMALAFCLKQRIADQHQRPLLSCADIRDILFHLLPSKITDEEAIMDMIHKRHQPRAADIKRCEQLSASG
jgi:SRSO17 transposase